MNGNVNQNKLFIHRFNQSQGQFTSTVCTQKTTWLAITKPFLDPSTRYKNSSHNEQEPLEIRGQKLRAQSEVY